MMRSAMFLLAVAASVPTAAGSFCDVINPDLPSECGCTEQTLGFIAECQMDVFGDTVGVKIDVSPCASEASMSLEVTDTEFGIDYPIASLAAGTDEDIPIPGLSFDIPVVGSAGAVLDVAIDGNADSLDLKVGLDACIDVPIIGKECGSKVTSELPYVLLSSTYSFGDLCNGAQQVLAQQAAPALRSMYHMTAGNLCYEVAYTDANYAKLGYKRGTCASKFNSVLATTKSVICNGHSEANIKTCPNTHRTISVAKKGIAAVLLQDTLA